MSINTMTDIDLSWVTFVDEDPTEPCQCIYRGIPCDNEAVWQVEFTKCGNGCPNESSRCCDQCMIKMRNMGAMTEEHTWECTYCSAPKSVKRFYYYRGKK